MAQNGWVIMEIPWEIPMNMDDLGLPPMDWKPPCTK